MVYEQDRFREQEVTLLLEGTENALITPCPAPRQVALGTEALLSRLPVYDRIRLINGATDE